MGTLFSITLYAPNADAARAAFSAAFERIRKLDEILSDYKQNSELMQVCRSAHAAPVMVSPELFTVLEASERLSQATDGAFDVTLGPVIRLWRQARIEKHLPNPEQLAAAARRCGYRNLVLDSAHRTVFLKLADMQLDLGAIAKGYAADEALAVLRAHGITRALVAASGDLAIGDAPPGQPGWRVGIDSLDTPGSKFTRVLVVHNIAVSTSGDTEQYLEVGGTRYSHIIDPKTNLGLTQRIAVTVVASRGINADSLATAASVLGVQRGLGLIDRRNDAAALIVTRGPYGTRTQESKRFRILSTSGR